MCVKIEVLVVKQKARKRTKRSSGPNTDLLGHQKRGGGRADLKNTGVKKLSSFIWTLVVKSEITGVELVSLELEDSEWEFTGVELVSLELEESYWERERAPTDPPPNARHPCTPESLKAH